MSEKNEMMSRASGAGPIVLHVPHASIEIPADLRSSFLVPDQALQIELLKMTDWDTDELFQLPGAPIVRFPVSRLVVDPERFLDDAEEPMASRGMGVLYTTTSSGGVLRSAPDGNARLALIERFYSPHHQALEAAVDEKLMTCGECVVVDCHSFPSVPLPYEDSQDPDRPDLCIGTDPFHTPDSLVEYIRDEARNQGLSVKLNTPFSGSLVPMKHYRKRKTAFSVMLEINRSLYMDEATGRRSDDFEEIREKVGELLWAIDAWHEDTFRERLLDDGEENCPICDRINNPNEVVVCEHFVGRVIEGYPEIELTFIEKWFEALNWVGELDESGEDQLRQSLSGLALQALDGAVQFERCWWIDRFEFEANYHEPVGVLSDSGSTVYHRDPVGANKEICRHIEEIVLGAKRILERSN